MTPANADNWDMVLAYGEMVFGWVGVLMFILYTCSGFRISGVSWSFCISLNQAIMWSFCCKGFRDAPHLLALFIQISMHVSDGNVLSRYTHGPWLKFFCVIYH